MYALLHLNSKFLYGSPQTTSTRVRSNFKPKVMTPVSRFDFKSYMLEKTNRINQALDSSVPLKDPVEIHESMRYTLLSAGKRIKPLLCLAACELVGGDEFTAMPSACALEMIHVTALIHDDLPCADNDDFRRGKPSNHVVFGEPIAMLAGDALVARAFEHIATNTRGVGPEKIVAVIGELVRLAGSAGLFGGQAADIICAGMRPDENTAMEQLEYISRLKTGALLEAAIVIGAVLGGAVEEEIERLRKYSRCVGLMFQVMDDVLDVTDDLLRDQLTYPKLIGFERSVELAHELNHEAQELLIGFDQEKAAPLIALGNFIVNRKE